MALPELITLRKSEHQTTTKQLKPDIQPMYIYKQLLPNTFPVFHTKLPTPAKLRLPSPPVRQPVPVKPIEILVTIILLVVFPGLVLLKHRNLYVPTVRIARTTTSMFPRRATKQPDTVIIL